jgi:transcription initiation factor TFIID subunit 5
VSLNRQPVQWGAVPCDSEAEAFLQQLKPKDPAGRPILHDPLSNAIAQYKKGFSSAMSSLPDAEAVPRPQSGSAELAAEVSRLKEIAARAHLSATALPSINCFTLHNSYDAVTSISINPTGTLMATGNRDSYIDVWTLTGEPLRAVKASTELAAMDLSDIDNIDGLKEAEGSPSKRLIGHSGPVYASRFLPPCHDRFLVSASQDKTLRLWSLDLFAPVVVYRSHTLPVWDVDVPTFAAAGPYFASASADRTARLWSTEHIHPLRIFAGHLSDVDTVRFHPNGNYVLTGSSDKTCRMWDIQSGACVRLLTGHERGVTALAVSPDGRYLASGDRLGHVKVWDLGEGKLLLSLAPPTLPNRTIAAPSPLAVPESPVYSLSFDQDGKILAQAGADAAVHLWDMSKGLTVPGTASGDSSSALLASYPTKQTPLYTCQFNRRNVLQTAGIFNPDF